MFFIGYISKPLLHLFYVIQNKSFDGVIEVILMSPD